MKPHTNPPGHPTDTNAAKLPHRSSAYASRRPPAHQSVSLLHPSSSSSLTSKKPSPPRAFENHPKTSSVTSHAATQSIVANPPSSSPASTRQLKQNSSGESSDAGRWFERSNNNVTQSNNFSPDNDPPFFLRNSSSSETPPEGALFPPTLGALQRAGLAGLPTEGSSDDFRSVIDDLTIANKQLKKKLRKYERMHDAHLQGERLFEVRFHGLPAHKKRELEETLRKFAISVDDPSVTDPSAESVTTGTGTGISGSQTNGPAILKVQETGASSHTSRFAESGYASMSASGQGNSSALSGQDSSHSKAIEKPAFNRNNSEIQSYLHDIPVGLMPRGNTIAMTEKSRKKLVVKRLEQIFAGKGAVGGHQQPMQQQEVANSAALADRKVGEAQGKLYKKEGNRIAKIMPSNGHDEDNEQNTDGGQNFGLAPRIAQQDFTGTASPDQRPTRPLDLDPHREQIPNDNIDYLRHLGFTPPDMGLSPKSDHGWLYLNLVINMAQLHTVNVTVDFVKQAVEEYSSKLELSNDGRKIRWKGGQDITRNSSDTSSERRGGISPDSVLDAAGSKGVKRPKRSNDDSDQRKKAQKLASLRKERENKLLYTPLFYRKEESEDEDEYSPVEASSLSSPIPGRDSSAFASSGKRTSSSKRRRDDGPIIFYNKANFCTDLSGDPNAFRDPYKNAPQYEPVATWPLGGGGAQFEHAIVGSERRDITGAFRNIADDIEMRDGSASSSTSSEFHLSLKSLENNLDNKIQPLAPDFEVSGLGGVQPQDNFAIHVVSRHVKKDAAPAPHSAVPHKLRSIIAGARKPNGSFTDEIISTKTETLPVSTLPPASFLPLDSSSPDAESLSDDDDSDADDADSDVDMLGDREPTVGRQPLSNFYSDDSSEYSSSEDDDEDDDDDAGSLDFLAAARKLAPEAVRAQEREYDSNVAERLAEEITAGSSAATAGGGSGFNSPVNGAAAGARGVERSVNLGRARTGNSLVAAMERE